MHTANRRTAEISTSGTAIVGMQHSYSRQRSTIGSFSATADFLVTIHEIAYSDEPMSTLRRVLRPARQKLGCFEDQSFQAIICMGSDN